MAIERTADVAVSVLTYERPETTKMFFDQLWKNTPHTKFDLFVVDNGSKTGTREVLENLPTETPAGGSVHLILLEENAGWCPGKNIGLAIPHAGGYPYVCLVENDCTCRSLSDAHGLDWIGMHVNALNSLGIEILQGRHAPKQHGDENYFWRTRKEGRVWWPPIDPHNLTSDDWNRSGSWLIRGHDELLTRMIFMRGSVVSDVGGFNEPAFPMKLGMFADTEWSDRILRRYCERHGLIWGISLDERMFEFLEINSQRLGFHETYPDEMFHHEIAKATHSKAFWERREYIWEHPDPDLYIGFSDAIKENAEKFWNRSLP
jgi:GT2 family glycosyltransferase